MLLLYIIKIILLTHKMSARVINSAAAATAAAATAARAAAAAHASYFRADRATAAAARARNAHGELAAAVYHEFDDDAVYDAAFAAADAERAATRAHADAASAAADAERAAALAYAADAHARAVAVEDALSNSIYVTGICNIIETYTV
jgi:hypothetical protein